MEADQNGSMYMRADILAERYPLEGHVEDGMFLERHYESEDNARPASGSIYYYVPAGTKTMFHVIDCDEYWIYNAGADIQLWMIDARGTVTVQRLGVGEGAEPKIYLPSGVIFASRHDAGAQDGTFLTCITVPRFRYDTLRLYSQQEIETQYPNASAFWAE